MSWALLCHKLEAVDGNLLETSTTVRLGATLVPPRGVISPNLGSEAIIGTKCPTAAEAVAERGSGIAGRVNGYAVL